MIEKEDRARIMVARSIYFCLWAAFLGGIPTLFAQQLEERIYRGERTYVTKVFSHPPGARIELDGNYMGRAPLPIVWEGDYGREFHDKPHVIKAFPVSPHHCVQIKMFWCGYTYYPNDAFPEKIYFDMNKCPPNPSVEFNTTDGEE